MPEVLLIDEVLGVGDQAFYAKCLEKSAVSKAPGNIVFGVAFGGPDHDAVPAGVVDRTGRRDDAGSSPRVVAAYKATGG